MPGTTRPRGLAGTPATSTGPRPCSPTWDRSRSTCRGTGDASFAPKIVAKRQRRLGGIDDLVISLVAKGLTTGEVQDGQVSFDGVAFEWPVGKGPMQMSTSLVACHN